MNDYRQRPNLNRRFEPSNTSMGKFFSNRLRNSLYTGGPLLTTTMADVTTNLGENYDQTTADDEATPEPPVGLYDLQRSVITPSSTSSMNDSYFTHTTRDIHKFSRRVELSSGYNILKNRTSSRPTRLPAFLQGRQPLAQLNPLPIATVIPSTQNDADEIRSRRLSFTDHHRTQNLIYNQQILQQYNADGTRRPFSSDSPLPPPMPSTTTTNQNPYYISSAPPMHNRTAYEPIELLKLPPEQEDSSIAMLSRELRAAAYPTTRKSAHHSPTREPSPPTSRHTNRMNSKRAPPRSLPKLHSSENLLNMSSSNLKTTPVAAPPPPPPPTTTTTTTSTSTNHHSHLHHQHSHQIERNLSTSEDRLLSSSAGSLLLDQFFSVDPTSSKELHLPQQQPPPQQQEPIAISHDKSVREHSSSSLLMRTSSIPNMADDTTMTFVSKYARLAPIPTSHTPLTHPVNPMVTNDEINHHFNLSLPSDFTHDQTSDTLHDLSNFHDENPLMSDEFLPTNEMLHPDFVNGSADENFSYVPLKEDLKSIEGVPLLELDELETSSDISESQLVPIIYAKELANEIDLLQKAHLLKQQQRSIAMSNEGDRNQDNNSVPPPANMELLNFEALEEENNVIHREETTPVASPRPPSTTMDISSSPNPPLPPPPLPLPVVPSSPAVTELETPMMNVLQHSILAHNRLSPWFRLPTELWFKILLYLKNDDLINFASVCKRFYLLAQDQACEHRIVMQRQMHFEKIWLDAIQRRKPISLSFIECRQRDLETTNEENQTEKDSVSSSVTTVGWLEFFQGISPSLTSFTMTSCYHEPFTPNTLLPILVETCSNLLSLHLRWNNMTENTLNHLTNYSQLLHLQTLDLTGCQSLDDTSLINMFVQRDEEFQLKTLILQACSNITWMSLDTIAICLPHLRHLNLSRCIGLKNYSSNEQTTCFSYWPQLESIDFGHLLTLTDNDLTIIFNHCKYLKTIILDNCIQLTDQTMQKLHSNVELLSLNNCTNISTNFLLNLNEQCPRLKKLNVSMIKNVNDQCLLHWSNQPFQRLKSFILDYCTDCTLNGGLQRFIQTHIQLEELGLNGNLISSSAERRTLQENYSRIKFVFQ